MLVPGFLIPTLTTICICGSIFIINNHCIKRQEDENERENRYVILREDTYNSITKGNIREIQPVLQEYSQPNTNYDEKQLPPNYNDIETNKN